MELYLILKDKKTKLHSKPIPIYDVIYNQNEIEFEFGKPNNENYATLTYNDFLFFKDDYEVSIHFGTLKI